MSIPVSPANNAIVLIDKMYADTITGKEGTTLFFDSSFNPEWNVTITGHVVSTPNKLTLRNEHGGLATERIGLQVDDLQPGDEAIFKYLVVEDKEWIDDRSFFYMVDDQPRYKSFVNGLKEEIKIWAITPKHYAAVYLDRDGNIIDGRNGKRSEIEKWANQFPMLNDGELRYKNLFIHDGVLYWKVDYSMLIGYIKEEEVDGKVVKKLHAGRGYVFAEPIEIDLGDKSEGGIIIPEHMRKQRSRKMGVVRYVGKPRVGSRETGVQVGDNVVWREGYGEQYEIGGLPWIVLKHEQIIGKLT